MRLSIQPVVGSRWGQVALLSSMVLMGTLAAQAQAQKGSGMEAVRGVLSPNRLHFEGTKEKPYHFRIPGLDVTALTVDVDIEGKILQRVRATNNVTFDITVPSKVPGETTRIHATSDIATLEPKAADGKRRLTLRGNVNGYYDVGVAPNTIRNSLRGATAVFKIGANGARDLDVTIEGGSSGFEAVIPASMFPTAIGGTNNFDSIVITGNRGTFDTESSSLRVLGKARAEGKNKDGSSSGNFLVTATDFVVSRDASGKMNMLQTVGRTKMKIDLPPAPPTAAPTEVTAPTGTATAGSKGPGMPTSMEADADKATVTFADSKLVFEGNVKGQYELRSDDGTTNRYNFTSEKVVVRSLPKAEGDLPMGLSVEVTPATIELPSIGLGLE